LGLDALLGISPKTFLYNGLGGHPASDKPELGCDRSRRRENRSALVVSKEMKLHADDKTTTEIKQVNYTAFTYVLINAVKDLYHRWFDDSQEIHRELASKTEEIRQLKQDNATIKAYLCAKDPNAPICK
jgi:hypothetical protein